MKTFKFKYIVSSERLSYIYAEDKKEAEDKLMKIMQKMMKERLLKKLKKIMFRH